MPNSMGTNRFHNSCFVNDSHVQIVITDIRPAVRFPLSSGEIFIPSRRGHILDLLWRIANGGHRNPFHLDWVYFGHQC